MTPCIHFILSYCADAVLAVSLNIFSYCTCSAQTAVAFNSATICEQVW